MAMSGSYDWNEIDDTKSSSGNKSSYLKLKSGQEYKIRPVHKTVRIFKYFYKNDGQLRTAIVADPTTCTVPGKHTDVKLKPVERYVFLALDRQDGNQLKILEVPKKVVAPLAAKAKRSKIGAGKQKGAWDWYITVKGTGLETTYEVVQDEQTDLTTEEVKLVEDFFQGDMGKLLSMYKPCENDEEIEQKLFGPPVVKDKKNNNVQVAAQVKKPAVVVEDTDEMEDSSDETSEEIGTW